MTLEQEERERRYMQAYRSATRCLNCGTSPLRDLDEERVAAVLHDGAHRGWHRWFADGRECPDGRADSNVWVQKARTLIADLEAAGLVIREAAE